MGLLLWGSSTGDKIARDLRARAERACSNPTSAQLLGYHAHVELSETEASILRVDTDAEHPQLRHLGNDVIWNQGIGEMPLMRLRSNPFGRETAKLIPDHIQGFVTERLGWAMLL